MNAARFLASVKAAENHPRAERDICERAVEEWPGEMEGASWAAALQVRDRRVRAFFDERNRREQLGGFW